jgi:DNA-binding XRE family transcriptional regulator
MKIKINKKQIIRLLDGRSISWLRDKMNDEYNINITLSGLNHVLNGRSDPKLIYIVAIALILNVPIDHLYSVEYNV